MKLILTGCITEILWFSYDKFQSQNDSLHAILEVSLGDTKDEKWKKNI